MNMLIDAPAPAGRQTVAVRNPYSGETIDTVPLATPEDVDAVLDAARRGARAWAAAPIYQRADVLHRYAGLLEERRKELATLLCRESGKTFRQTLAEVGTNIRLARGNAERVKTLRGETIPSGAQAGFEHDVMLTRREPLGVVAAIIPFNFPVDIFGHKALPALAAGNAVVVLPPLDDPLTILTCGELLREAGLPGGVLQIVTGEGPVVGEALTTSPKVDAIALTGSTATGVRAARAGATHLARMVLELGGNDPLIVFDDADLDRATEQAVLGRILANGQCCCANKRLIVQRGVQDEFARRVTAAMSAVPVGDPSVRETGMGPLINERAAARVHDQVRQTVEQGAHVLTGGERGDGLLYPPTVLDGVTPEMDVARDMEIFGPVLPIIAFDTADEAVEIANNSHFGLSAAVFTRDLARGIDLGYRIQSGVVCLNGTGLYRSDDTPFGGYKMSGLGREGLGYSLEEMTQLKAVVLCNVLS